VTCGSWLRAAILSVCASSCGHAADRPAEPIPEVPPDQQRAIRRGEFRWQWPFTVGTGTLGCVDGAVAFRTAGRSYALNDTARALGLASAAPLRQIGSTGPPSNPLKTVPQDRRMRLFADTAVCGQRFSGPEEERCKQRLRKLHDLSDQDLRQIEAEGYERLWPPLAPAYISLEPMIEAGLALCPP
jgi:hypothetical protein